MVFAALLRQSRPPTVYLTDFFFQKNHCTNTHFFNSVNFVLEVFAGVQNNEYHHIRFHCTEVDSGVIHSVARKRQLCAHTV